MDLEIVEHFALRNACIIWNLYPCLNALVTTVPSSVIFPAYQRKGIVSKPHDSIDSNRLPLVSAATLDSASQKTIIRPCLGIGT